MFATLLTLGFAGTAIIALASVAVSLRQGLAAVSALRSDLAACSDTRTLTVWSAETGLSSLAGRGFTPERTPRRAARPAARRLRQRHLAAA